MKFEGTPGPWTGKDVGICKQDRAGLQLGFIMSSDEKRVAECAANAHLIAAAPELLDALQSLLSAWRNGSSKDVVKAEKKARAAIAKAIGKEE